MKQLTLLMLVFLLLAACGNEESGTASSGNIEPLTVEILTPEKVEAEEPTLLSASVMQGEETVEDADEVIFEVWESGNRNGSEMIEAKHAAEGVYEAEAELGEGLYFIQAHTTARLMHAMPKQEVTVGNPDPASIVPDDSDDAEGMKNVEEHTGH
jgi:hypothetical protein